MARLVRKQGAKPFFLWMKDVSVVWCRVYVDTCDTMRQLLLFPGLSTSYLLVWSLRLWQFMPWMSHWEPDGRGFQAFLQIGCDWGRPLGASMASSAGYLATLKIESLRYWVIVIQLATSKWSHLGVRILQFWENHANWFVRIDLHTWWTCTTGHRVR